MKAYELMIGDWADFYHPYEPEKRIVTRHHVTDIYGCGLVGIDNHNNPVHASHLEPIKITSEVLEKNGFEKQQDNYVFFDNDEGLNITFYPKSSNYTNGAYNYIDIEKGCLTISEMPITFVHELQHVLTLCESEKEIIL